MSSIKYDFVLQRDFSSDFASNLTVSEFTMDLL